MSLLDPSHTTPTRPNSRAIVDLSREVLASFSCPPLPTLTGGSSGTPYLSFSLWVTDPLWMAISRCRNPTIRQAAFTLLSQNPRQEGIWHAGPQLSNNKYMRRVEAGPSVLKETVKGRQPPDSHKRKHGRNPPPPKPASDSGSKTLSEGDSKSNSPQRNSTEAASRAYEETPEEVERAPLAGNMRVRAEW